MKLYKIIISLIIISIILNIINYNLFLKYLAIIWGITSILIIYTGIKYSYKYKLLQFNIKKIIKSFSSNYKSISSLCITLAGKIGVGSLSGVALTLYFGGIGSIFWLIITSIFLSINTYKECILGIKYKSNDIGGPSYYIKKCLHDNKLSILYSILIIICYSVLFLSIQSNTIMKTISIFNIDKYLFLIIFIIITYIIINYGVKGISIINTIIVPIMILFYFFIGIYIIINNNINLIDIFKSMLYEAFKIKSIIPIMILGIQRGIFITESSLGTSAISSSITNDYNQGLMEIFGTYIIIFLSFITFIIIYSSDYLSYTYNNLNGIEIVIHAFNYHFPNNGKIILSIICILFAFSTIISSYYFGISNLYNITKKDIYSKLYKYLFIFIIIISFFIKANTLWNFTDFFISLLIIINLFSILKINE